MRRLLALLVLSVLAAPLARADGSIALNARAGVARPFGDASKDHALDDSVEWAFPLQADVQFRFSRPLSIGAYARYAPAQLASTASDGCDALNLSCSVTDIGFGAIAEYRFRDRLEGGPWVGAQVGWELLKAEEPLLGAKVSTTTSGLEAGLSAGMDFELGGLTLGPWASVMAGQFSKVKVESASSSISDKAIHGWFQVGLRLSLLL